MPFGTFSLGPESFESRAPGQYVLAGSGFSDPANELTVRAVSARRDGNYSFGVGRSHEKDDAETGRVKAFVSLNVVFPKDGNFSSTELNTMITDLSEFLTSSRITRIAQGET